MRVLCLTNFYPPVVYGGYELWCQEVSEKLIARGHDVQILTSRTGQRKTDEVDANWIHRNLFLEMEFDSFWNSIRFFTSRKSREMENLACLKDLIETFHPDVILIWGMWNLPRSLPALAEKLMTGKVAYYIGDYWPTQPSQFENYWLAPAKHQMTGAIKKLLGGTAHRMMNRETTPRLQFEHMLFPTEFMHEELMRSGIIPRHFKIINGAIDTAPFLSRNGHENKPHNRVLTLLYVGRLISDKGVHTAVEAIGTLVNQHQVSDVKLKIVGSGEEIYETQLRDIVRQMNIEQHVIFYQAQPAQNMPEIYHQADILLFTSIWPEPFGRVLIEGMAAGLPIIGTATGGAGEILIENENALLFSPGDPASLAEKILKLMNSPQLMNELSERGQQFALEKYGIDRMVNGVEEYLGWMIAK